MSRDNISDCIAGEGVGATPETDRNTRFLSMGWNDFLAGKPIPLVYDTWETNDQINYENGRRAVAMARHYTRKIPHWGKRDTNEAIDARVKNKAALRAAEAEVAWCLYQEPPAPKPIEVATRAGVMAPSVVEALLERLGSRRH